MINKGVVYTYSYTTRQSLLQLHTACRLGLFLCHNGGTLLSSCPQCRGPSLIRNTNEIKDIMLTAKSFPKIISENISDIQLLNVV